MENDREDRPLRMNAYYYSFEPTGVPAIDLILSAVAHAGKAYHHTVGWTEPEPAEPPFRGDTHAEWIQNAANDAAAIFTPAGAERKRCMNWQPIETAPKDGEWIIALIASQGHPVCPVCVRWDTNAWVDWDYEPIYELTHWMPLPDEMEKSLDAESTME